MYKKTSDCEVDALKIKKTNQDKGPTLKQQKLEMPVQEPMVKLYRNPHAQEPMLKQHKPDYNPPTDVVIDDDTGSEHSIGKVCLSVSWYM